jgi:hypothetical protein
MWSHAARPLIRAAPIEFCVSNRVIAPVCPLTCILSPNGGEGRVRGGCQRLTSITNASLNRNGVRSFRAVIQFMARCRSRIQQSSGKSAHSLGYLQCFSCLIGRGIFTRVTHLNSIGCQALECVSIHRNDNLVLQAQVTQSPQVVSSGKYLTSSYEQRLKVFFSTLLGVEGCPVSQRRLTPQSRSC